jgi:hypothetical protein
MMLPCVCARFCKNLNALSHVVEAFDSELQGERTDRRSLISCVQLFPAWRKIGDLRFPFKQDKLRRLARIHEYKSAPTHNTRHSNMGLFTIFFTRLHLEKARGRRHPEERRATPDTQADLFAPTQADLVTPHDRPPVPNWIDSTRKTEPSEYLRPRVVSLIACGFKGGQNER